MIKKLYAVLLFIIGGIMEAFVLRSANEAQRYKLQRSSCHECR